MIYVITKSLSLEWLGQPTWLAMSLVNLKFKVSFHNQIITHTVGIHKVYLHMSISIMAYKRSDFIIVLLVKYNPWMYV